MKRPGYILLASLTAGPAWAGFRHPLEQSGGDAQAIQSAAIHPAPPRSPRMVPDRLPSASQAGARGPAHGNAPASAAVTRSPALPAAAHFAIPGISIPSSAKGDGLLTMRPEALSLKGANRAQIHSFLRHARKLPLPRREFTGEVRSRAIADRYRAALHPSPYRSFRSSYKLRLGGIAEIQQPPSPVQYENMVKRLDSLFSGLSLRYPQAIVGLWELARSPTNPRHLQARDSLFAGLISARAGWETPAALLLEESVTKRVEREDRYLDILWIQLDGMANPAHTDRIVSRINPARILDRAPAGDKATFAMFKRMLSERPLPPRAPNPPSAAFAGLLSSDSLRDRASLLSLLAQLRSSRPDERTQATAGLRGLDRETVGQETRQEARLALARELLRKGEGSEALALYRAVSKNGKNRLEVLAEQTYAEYLAGEFQESLGKAMGLQSPYFQYGFAPDIHLVEILSRNAMCDFGGAEAGVRRLTERYIPELDALDRLTAAKPDPASYYERLLSYHGLERPMRHQRYLLRLPVVLSNQKTMNSALDDLRSVDALGTRQKTIDRPAGWSLFAASMRDGWNVLALELRRDSAETALTEAAYLARRLRHTLAQLELLDLDISAAAARDYNLQGALNFPARRKTEVEVDRDKLRWPYENEVWEDEIDFLRARNPSKCAIAAAVR